MSSLILFTLEVEQLMIQVYTIPYFLGKYSASKLTKLPQGQNNIMKFKGKVAIDTFLNKEKPD